MAEVIVSDPDTARYVVRYGTMRLLGDFEARRQSFFHRNDEVVVRSERGIEWGTVLSAATEKTASYLGSTRASGVASCAACRTKTDVHVRNRRIARNAAFSRLRP